MKRLSASAMIRRIAALGRRRPEPEPTTFLGRSVDVKYTVVDHGRSYVVLDVEHEGGTTEVYMNAREYAAVDRALSRAANLAFGPAFGPSLPPSDETDPAAWDRRN